MTEMVDGDNLMALQAELERRIASLQRTYWQTIRMCAQMIEALDPDLGGHSRRTAALSLEMARRCRPSGAIPEKALPILEAAALLHDVGLLLLPRTVRAKRRNERTGDEQNLYQQHPASGARILGELEILKPVARLVGLHHEQPNGKGFPNGLNRRCLPLLARILSAASIFDNLVHRGGYESHQIPEQLHRMRNVQLASEMVDLLLEINHESLRQDQRSDIDTLAIEQLEEGMVLAMDLTRISGAILVPKGTQLTRYAIEKMINYNRLRSIGDKVAVYRVP